MLTWLGVAAIAALLVLILFRLTSVLVALVLVPVAAAVAGGFAPQLGSLAMDGILGVTPVAVLLAFAVIYFGLMHDAGLFAPLIASVLRLVGRDPVRVVLATAAIAAITHLDGAGASTFMVTVPALLPLYVRLGMSPLALTCTAALAAGTMNILPWGGPVTRAAAALQVSPAELFFPVLPAMIAGLASVFVVAVHVGRQERRRVSAAAATTTGTDARAVAWPEPGLETEPLPGQGWRWYANALLTVTTLVALFAALLPLPLVFIMASAVALPLNFPRAHDQRERLSVHGGVAMTMVTIIIAAGVFMGVLTGTGMLDSMAADLVRVLPQSVLRHLPVLMALASMPLSLVFDPDSFYFGVLPVLARATQNAGGSAVDLGRAAILGQMSTGFPVSPLTPSTFLLIGLANVDLADHQRRTIGYAFVVTLVMAAVAFATGAIRF